MKANVQILKTENIAGHSEKSGRDYDLDFCHFLDVETFDKFKLLVPKDQLSALSSSIGKRGVLEVAINAKTDKLEFSGFKVAA